MSAHTERIEKLKSSTDLEIRIITNILADTSVTSSIIERLKADWFSDKAARITCGVVKSLCSANRQFDLTATIAALKDKKLYEDVGGDDWFAYIYSGVLPYYSEDLPLWIDELERRYLLKRTAEIASQIAREAQEFVVDVPKFLSSIPSRFLKAPEVGGGLATYEDVADLLFARVESYYNKSAAEMFMPTGLTSIDRYFGGGLQPGLHIIAGRTGDGKTEVALSMALGNRAAGKRVRFDQLELGDVNFYEKVLSKLAGKHRGVLVQGGINRDDIDRIMYELYDTPMLSSRKTYSVDQLEQSLQRDRDKFDILYIDQFDKLINTKSNELESHNYNTEQLLRLSKEYKLPLVVLAQLNREVEKRADRKPVKSDIKACGQLEQTADVVMLLSRPNKGKSGDVLELEIAKDRLMESWATFEFARIDGELKSVQRKRV